MATSPASTTAKLAAKKPSPPTSHPRPRADSRVSTGSHSSHESSARPRSTLLSPEVINVQAPHTIRAGQEAVLKLQTGLAADFKTVSERQSIVLSGSEELIREMRAYIERSEEQHRQERIQREVIMREREAELESERKARDEKYNRETRRILEEVERERKEAEEAHRTAMTRLTKEHQTVMQKITGVFMQFVNDERSRAAEQRRKEDDKRLQDTVGLRFGLGTTILIIASLGTGVVTILGPSVPVVSGVLGAGSLALTYTTNAGKVFWKKIRQCFGRCTPECLALEDAHDETLQLLTLDSEDSLLVNVADTSPVGNGLDSKIASERLRAAGSTDVMALTNGSSSLDTSSLQVTSATSGLLLPASSTFSHSVSAAEHPVVVTELPLPGMPEEMDKPMPPILMSTSSKLSRSNTKHSMSQSSVPTASLPNSLVPTPTP